MEDKITKVEHPLENITIDKDVLVKLQGFQTQFLQKEPNEKELRKNEFANNSLYLPISFMEMTLDEIFFGLWQTKNFTTKTVANEIIGELELWVFHPVAREWICRIGAGAVMIQYEAEYEMVEGKKQKIKTNITDISKKITNTLTKDYPHLKAECFRNACLSLGKLFGRDLNRKFDDEYTPLFKEVKPLSEEEQKKVELKKKVLEISNKVINALDHYQGNDKDEIKKACIIALSKDDLKYFQTISPKLGIQ